MTSNIERAINAMLMLTIIVLLFFIIDYRDALILTGCGIENENASDIALIINFLLTWEMVWLICTPAQQHCRDCFYHDFEIEPERPFVDIFEVHLHPVVKIFDVVSAAALPETGDTRFDG